MVLGYVMSALWLFWAQWCQGVSKAKTQFCIIHQYFSFNAQIELQYKPLKVKVKMISYKQKVSCKLLKLLLDKLNYSWPSLCGTSIINQSKTLRLTWCQWSPHMREVIPVPATNLYFTVYISGSSTYIHLCNLL